MRRSPPCSAWEAHAKGQNELAKELFEGSEKHLASNFLPHVFEYLKARDVEFFRAPYFAWSQVRSRLSNSSLTSPLVLHCVCTEIVSRSHSIDAQLAYFSYAKQHFAGLWAGPEVFLHGVSKLIIDIDFARGTFDWVDMTAVLMNLNLLPEQVRVRNTVAPHGFDNYYYMIVIPVLRSNAGARG